MSGCVTVKALIEKEYCGSNFEGSTRYWMKKVYHCKFQGIENVPDRTSKRGEIIYGNEIVQKCYAC